MIFCTKRAIVLVIFLALIVAVSIMKPNVAYGQDLPISSESMSDDTISSMQNQKIMYHELDETLSKASADAKKLQLDDSHYIAKNLKAQMDEYESFKSNDNSLTEEQILSQPKEVENEEQRAAFLNSLRDSRAKLENDNSQINDHTKDRIHDLDNMIEVLEIINTGDQRKIKEIKPDKVQIFKKSFGNEIASNIQSLVKISQIDVKVSKNADISTLPYSETTGKLQFNSISWANLGPIIGRIKIAWVDENEERDEIHEILVSDHIYMNQARTVNLGNFDLREGASFKFRTNVMGGVDSSWSKWYTYSKTANFAVGYYTDRSAFTRKYSPIPVVYGDVNYVQNVIQSIAEKASNKFIKVLIFGGISIAVSGVISVFTIGAQTAALAMHGIVTGFLSGIVIVATDIILTVNMSEIDVEDVDLDLQSKERNWYIDETGVGHFAISGFQFVSGGYYWSKPVVHWRSPNESGNVGHRAYVNETDKKGKNKDEIRLGKAAGAALADLARSPIVDQNDENCSLREGDIIWFEAEVTSGKNRVAKERFIFLKNTGFQAGYFTQGTTLLEKGYGTNPKAHLASFGELDKVAYEMSQFIMSANSAYWSMVISVSLGLVFVLISTVVDLYLTVKDFGGFSEFIVQLQDERYLNRRFLEEITKNGQNLFPDAAGNLPAINGDEFTLMEQAYENGKLFADRLQNKGFKMQNFANLVKRHSQKINEDLEYVSRQIADNISCRELLITKVQSRFIAGLKDRLHSMTEGVNLGFITIPSIFTTLSTIIRFFSGVGRGSFIFSSELYAFIDKQVQLEKFYNQQVLSFAQDSPQNETSALMLSLMGPVSDNKATLYQIFYDIQTYIDSETDQNIISELSAFADKILYTLYKMATEGNPMI